MISDMVAGADGPAVAALGAVVPHAGYVYSGAVAGRVYGAIEVPRDVIILGPNHTGIGDRGAVWHCGAWQIPGRSVPIADDLAARVLAHSDQLSPNVDAHRDEHSLEVQVPFLVARRSDVRIVPIVLGGRWSAAECRALGRALASAIDEHGAPVLVVASSDMHHQGLDDLPPGRLTEELVSEKDAYAFDRLEAFDADGLLDVCRREHITMCGVVPTAVMLHTTRIRGADRVESLAHTNSHEVAGGDRRWVVGYAGYRVVASNASV